MGLYFGIFLVTLSGLMFEIGLTRIFSATIWYHYAFVAISVALLGWGLGGFALHLLRRRIGFSRERAALLALLYGLSIPAALWLVVRTPMLPSRLAFYFLVALVPFFLAGMALAMLFALGREEAGRLYFADLVGASAGALAITFLLGWLGGERAMLCVALAPIAAAAAFSSRLRWAAGLGALAVVAALAANERTGFFSIRNAPTKAMYRHLAHTPGTKIVLTGWNAYSRIDAVTGFESPYVARLYIDSDAWTNVVAWDGTAEDLADEAASYRSLPFRVAPPHAKTLIIGPGGGFDVLVALACGASKVTAVEMNPLMFRFARHFGAQAGHLYDQPLVEPVLAEGRTYVRRTDRRFDVILLGFVDSWAAVASGGLSLSENHLYTVEAFRDYYDHLTPGGELVIVRWDEDIPRLVTNAIALLGREAAARQVAVLYERRAGDREEPPQMTFILKRRPFTDDETARMAEWSKVRPLIVPGHHVAEPYAGLLSGRTSLAEYEAEAPARVDPVYDDRPFFFARQKPWGLPGSMRRAFVQILAPIGVLCALFLLFGKPRGERVWPYAGSVVYFACLGLGFIAVELSLLQHLTLLLGHPIFTLSILLFTLLASGGVGSALSGRFDRTVACLAVAAVALVYALALPRVVPLLLPLPLAGRIAVAVLVVAPLGFLMGMPFPRGLSATGRGPFPPPPFYWGLNGVFSVVGSMATMVAAVLFGFTWAMTAGAATYLLAALGSRAFGAPASR
jgi:predicted membrane-bound spermidine synthase